MDELRCGFSKPIDWQFAGSPDHAEFIPGLLNQPSWLHFIGDRGVKTLDDARSYIVKGAVDMYAA